jgi:hypothetical protein
MKKLILLSVVLVLPVIFSGCGKKQAVTEKIPEPIAQEQTSADVSQKQEIAESETAPFPQEEDVARLFFSLINEKRIPEAVAMLDVSAVPNESAKQAWGVQFDVFESVSVKSMEPSSMGDEPENQKTYKVVLDAKIKPGSGNAAIPNYGWEDGENIRWVTIRQDSEGLWKIVTIGTGP